MLAALDAPARRARTAPSRNTRSNVACRRESRDAAERRAGFVARDGVAARQRRERAERVQPAGDALERAVWRRDVPRDAASGQIARERAARDRGATAPGARAPRAARCACARLIGAHLGAATAPPLRPPPTASAREGRRRDRRCVDVDLVADGGDGRHGHAATRARDALVVERPEIFARAAAAADDHESAPPQRFTRSSARAELVRRAVALHRRRHDDELARRRRGDAARRRCRAAPRRLGS